MSKEKLNKAQKEAVDYIKGPLLIVAGAGTGKTTVIASKIAYLIEKKLTEPQEILALTFTDKAAEEMQDRVDSLVALGYADIEIRTFHSFSKKLLEKHAIDIGLSGQFKLLTETAAWLLVRRNLYSFKLDYYRPLGNPTKHIHELLKHFSKCKDELITPANYLAYATGLAKGNSLNIDEQSRLSEIAHAYQTYNQLLLDNALLDFGDLIVYAHALLSTRKSILEQLQKKYKYILVDEFQDVNYAQYELIKLLADQEARLTVVGDDDQSIYAFRGASVSNIMRFKDDFPKAKEVVLNENYRSGQTILDKAYASIQHNNPDRLEVKLKLDKHLVAKNNKLPDAVLHIHEATLDDEVEAVVKEIAKLKQTDETSTWDDFAILVRANNHAEPFLSALHRQGIPYEFLSSTGLYRQPIVVDCLNFLKIIVDKNESAAIYRLLCLPFLNLRINDLHAITFAGKKKTLPYYALLKNSEIYGVSPEGAEQCIKLVTVLESGLRNLKSKKPYQLIVNFLEEIGYFKYLIDGEKNNNEAVIRKLYHLNEFLKYIKEFEIVSHDANAAEFLEHFTAVAESGDKGSLYQPSDTPDSVNILTVHSSKGLEYKYVFIVNCVEERFPTRTKGEGIEIPAELIKEQLPEGDSHYQEERRLFYVAMTRARERLYFTSASNYGGTRAKKVSRFLTEIGYVAKENVAVKKIVLPEVIIEEETVGTFAYTLPKAFSFSQIRAYETCPYQYKLAHILHIPTKGNASFSFGQTMHATLQAFYTRIQKLNSVQQVTLFTTPRAVTPTATATVVKTIKAPPLEELIKMYDEHWIGDWYKNERQREEFYENGKKILKLFYTSHEDNWTIPTNLESWFKIRVGDYLVHGRIDRIDRENDGSLQIIDYKTGKAKESLTGEDKEQLLIYQIAVEELPEYSHIGKPGKLTFFYLNDNLKTSFISKSEEITKLKNKLVGVIDKIHSKNFAATPSKFACDHCDFRDICDFRV